MQVVMKEELSDLLRAIADDLDIPNHMYEDAVVKYADVGEWLAQEDSELAKFDPDIFPQGSFRLGTMVRPINDSDEYDIDLVCHLKIKKENTTQQELKDRVGKRLEARQDIKKILKPSRRCWILDYPEPFHMDILPVIPNVERLPNGILLTDTELRRWQFSNPIDYAEWFKEQMKVVLLEKRAAYAKRYQMSIEDVPEYEVKTPLQRVVQILKRHRDVYFQNDPGNRPVSIIITTLAARAYRNQPNLYEALVSVATTMHEYIEKRDDGKWWVQNPVDEGENFADKWNEYPKRREAFFNWLEQVRDDFVSASQTESLIKSAAALSPALGRNAVSRAAASLGIQTNALTTKSATASAPQVPALGSTAHCIAPVWPISLQYQVSIKGSVHPGSPKSKVKWPLTQRPVPRNVWLRFEAKTSVPEPYQVRWQVVNTGQDAYLADGLRGDEFEESNGATKHIRWEATEYRGTHWIEAFIIRNGVCVARSQPFKVRIRG
ncbi:MAG: nucleotidyltransferase [Pirellulaceae bacterium]|nr:nucleotidyltransferase [Pirellulaceae bacterium]